MTYSLHHFSEGIFRSFSDNTILNIKKTFNNEDQTKTIDRFFRPIITTLFDTLQVQSILKRGVETLGKKNIFKKVSYPFSKYAAWTFLVSKAVLHISILMPGNALKKSSINSLKKVHDSMEALLPIASIVVAIATFNFSYIAGYFLHLALSYLETHESISHDMKSIYNYSAWTLGLTSVFLTKALPFKY